MSNAPLLNPSYEPEHPPINGTVPEVVARFGMATQIRWFQRFYRELNHDTAWDEYYIHSEHHKGLHCISCSYDFNDGYHGGGVIMDGWCCCLDSRMPHKKEK
jgi:hypothetical protein